MRQIKRYWTLQSQLPVAAAALFLTLAMALTYVSDLEVRRQARQTAAARLANVVDRLVTATGSSTPRAQERLGAVARLPDVIALLTRPAESDIDSVRTILAGLAGTGAGGTAVALWDLDARPVVVAVARGDTAGWMGPPTPVDTASVTPVLALSDSLIYYDLVAPVMDGDRRVGYLQRRTRVQESPSTQQTLATLIGPEGKVLIGTQGGIWTDLARTVDAPDSLAFGAEDAVAYQRAGEWQLGLGSKYSGTPWLLVVEMPMRVALEPTSGFLGRLTIIALILALGTTIAAGVMGRRITQPLRSLRETADGIRSGQLDLRAVVPDQHELAVVAEAFNAMASENDQHIKALATNEQRFRSLVTATAQIVWWTDPVGNITEPLASYQAFTGQTFESLRIGGCLTAAHPDDVENVRAAWMEAVTHRSLFEIEYRIRRHDGEYHWFSVRAVPILASEGVIREWVGTCTDITRQRDTEESLHRKEEELKQSQRLDAIGRLAGGVAHDFNNLLTAIVVPAELASARLPDGHPVREDLDEIRTAGLRAADLTRQLLAFGRQQVLTPVVLILDEVVESSSRMLRRVIPESVILDFANPGRPGKVKVDRTQLEQVIINLAVNARDAMPDGGRLTIETEAVELTPEFCARHEGITPGRYVMLAVTDTGVGMDEQTRGQVFEPFFTTKPMGKGTGLGLSTVYGIVRQSGGHIWVYSEPGRGTAIKVYFPEADGVAVASNGVDPSAPTPTGSSTILLAEDDPALLKLGSRLLTGLGYQVLTGQDGESALKVAQAHDGTIDLLVSDVVMPGMSGVELWEHLRRIRPGIPVLFLSGWASDAVIRHRILEGDVPFVQKPFTADQLGRKVDEVIRKAKA